ncbi:ankyrin-1-like [Panicum miliaceum]|uniref:Ankyrin-1-like n=1 Tax=Panicum miliaceum TaxID=4540 RepID=A0A3L6THA0_PANMI|nr:ankyrin-1-like [Panicum miliaceum]
MDTNLPLPDTFRMLLHTDDQDQWPPEATLLVAAYHGNVRRLKEIATRMDVDGRGVHSMLRRTAYKGMNALHAAAGGKGLLPIFRYLVEEAKMDVNKRDTFMGKNMTPLQHAVFSGNLPVVRYLLDHGADIHQEGNLEGHHGLIALHTAAEKGRCAIAKFLLSRGAYVDGKSCHATPVHLAVLGGHDSTLKILLDHNADPNKEVNLSTPLARALHTPSLPCLKLLIQAGAKVNGIGNPLALAARKGLTEAIKCLLEAGANPNSPDTMSLLSSSSHLHHH